MDPITLIVTALAAGAVLGVKDIASAAVKDASTGLKGAGEEAAGRGRTRNWCSPSTRRPPSPGKLQPS